MSRTELANYNQQENSTSNSSQPESVVRMTLDGQYILRQKQTIISAVIVIGPLSTSGQTFLRTLSKFFLCRLRSVEMFQYQSTDGLAVFANPDAARLAIVRASLFPERQTRRKCLIATFTDRERTLAGLFRDRHTGPRWPEEAREIPDEGFAERKVLYIAPLATHPAKANRDLLEPRLRLTYSLTKCQ